MAMIKCIECGNEIDDNAKICIHCGCPMSTNKVDRTSSDKKTEETINNILYESKAVPVILIICGIISIFLGLTAFDNIIFAIAFGGALVIVGILSKYILEWMAHILKNIYEINKNTRK